MTFYVKTLLALKIIFNVLFDNYYHNTRRFILLLSFLTLPLVDYCCLVYNDLTAEQNTNKLKRLVNCGV